MAKTTDKQTGNRRQPPKNGKKWQKGQSGNPNGRPRKDICLTSKIKELLEREPERLEELALAVINNTVKGNPGFLKELWQHLEPDNKDDSANQTKLDELIAGFKGKYGTLGEAGSGLPPGGSALERDERSGAVGQDVPDLLDAHAPDEGATGGELSAGRENGKDAREKRPRSHARDIRD